jgi:hypothetical protein
MTTEQQKLMPELLDGAAAHHHEAIADALEALRDRLGKDALSVEEWNALVGSASHHKIEAWRRNTRSTTPPSAGKYQELVEKLGRTRDLINGYEMGEVIGNATEAADAIRTLIAERERLREALTDWRNSWLCPVGPFDADRLLRLTDSILELTPIAGEYE